MPCPASLLGGSAWHVSSPAGHFAPGAGGGRIFMTKEVGLSFGPNGPGTLFLTGGRLRKKATMALASDWLSEA